MSDQFSLEKMYDEYPRIEEAFQAALDISLEPRGPELLYDLVRDLRLPAGASVVDVGCGEGKQALELAERFGFAVTGFDPVPRHVELANEALRSATERLPEPNRRVRFEVGAAEAIPVGDASVDLVWCKDVLLHVAALDVAYGEFRRILRDGGRAVVYQSLFITDPPDPRDAERQDAEQMWKTSGVVAANTDPNHTDAAIAAAGLRVDECLDVGVEWSEWMEEQSGRKSRALLHLARLLRAPERYIAQFGQEAYAIMLADCFWHVDHMTGRRTARVYLLTRG